VSVHNGPSAASQIITLERMLEESEARNDRLAEVLESSRGQCANLIEQNKQLREFIATIEREIRPPQDSRPLHSRIIGEIMNMKMHLAQLRRDLKLARSHNSALSRAQSPGQNL
jgi:predicted RNase H-like nuclease (RuvC/YqgF family)